MTRPSRSEEFQGFVEDSFSALSRTGYLLCGDRHRAEDATQEALLRMYAKWTRVAPDARLAYARRCLARILVDESRRPWRREVPHDRPSDAGGAGSEQGHQPQDRVADQDEIVRALARLSPRQRGCVVLRYYQDLSVRDTAEALGCSEGNVKRATSDALAALRHLIDPPFQQEEHHESSPYPVARTVEAGC